MARRVDSNFWSGLAAGTAAGAGVLLALNSFGRRRHADVFLRGDYVPVYANGRMAQHVCAFLRTYKKESVLVAVPRFTTVLTEPEEFPVGPRIWKKSTLSLPLGMRRQWKHVLTGERLNGAARSRTLLLSNIFSEFPVALLYSA